jgi:hypothetical protein
MKVKTKVRAAGLSANHNVTVKLVKNGVRPSRGKLDLLALAGTLPLDRCLSR